MEKHYSERRILLPYKVKDMVSLDLIMGVTLEKFCKLKDLTPTSSMYLIRTPSLNELVGNCDACPVRHSPLNTGCSMNWNRKTKANKLNTLYNSDFTKVGFYKILNIDGDRNAVLSTCTIEFKPFS